MLVPTIMLVACAANAARANQHVDKREWADVLFHFAIAVFAARLAVLFMRG